MNTLRCSICDRTNNKDLYSLYTGRDGTYNNRFLPDPTDDKDFICFECNTEIQDLLYEYDINIETRKDEFTDLTDSDAEGNYEEPFE